MTQLQTEVQICPRCHSQMMMYWDLEPVGDHEYVERVLKCSCGKISGCVVPRPDDPIVPAKPR